MVSEKEKDLRFIFIFLVIVTLAFIYLFQVSYAKYRKLINAQVDVNVASWRIKVNNEDVRNKKTLTNTIKPVFLETDYSKADVIAPGSEGYFDIIIDTSNVDVNLNYEVTVDNTTDSTISDLIVTSYIVNPDTNEEKIDYVDKISNDIVYNDEETTIRIFIKWDDSEGSSMSNEEDTNVAIEENPKALIGVKIMFNQIKNS